MTGLAPLSLAALAVAASPEPVHRIGFLGLDSAMQATRIAAFRDEMRKLGYVEGRNLVVETRWAQGRFDRLPALADELVAQKPEVIVTAAPPAVSALQKATTTIPIVMSVHNPVAMGYAASLAKPGGNITGIAFQDSDLSVRRLDLLRSVVPNLGRVAIVWNEAAGGMDAVRAVEHAAESMKIASRVFEVHGPGDMPQAVADAKAWGAQGLVQLASPVITFNRKALLQALAAHRMPATCEMRLYVEEGCLMTYSADLDTMFRGLAAVTARILKGAKPADVPIEQPREFDFVINLKTAQALGLTVAPVVLLQTTDRIQ
ncbi:MAG: ABC transporter substrate-binding protein [Burkholderiales bacterium]